MTELELDAVASCCRAIGEALGAGGELTPELNREAIGILDNPSNYAIVEAILEGLSLRQSADVETGSIYLFASDSKSPFSASQRALTKDLNESLSSRAQGAHPYSSAGGAVASFILEVILREYVDVEGEVDYIEFNELLQRCRRRMEDYVSAHSKDDAADRPIYADLLEWFLAKDAGMSDGEEATSRAYTTTQAGFLYKYLNELRRLGLVDRDRRYVRPTVRMRAFAKIYSYPLERRDDFESFFAVHARKGGTDA